MSVMTGRAPGVLGKDWEAPRLDEDMPDPVSPSKLPGISDVLQGIIPLIFVVPVAGPPAILLLGPLLLLVLLLIPPTALLITLMLVLLLGVGLLVALGALIASPYLLVRHLRARHPLARPTRAASETSGRDGWPVRQPVGAALIHPTTR